MYREHKREGGDFERGSVCTTEEEMPRELSLSSAVPGAAHEAIGKHHVLALVFSGWVWKEL